MGLGWVWLVAVVCAEIVSLVEVAVEPAWTPVYPYSKEAPPTAAALADFETLGRGLQTDHSSFFETEDLLSHYHTCTTVSCTEALKSFLSGLHGPVHSLPPRPTSPALFPTAVTCPRLHYLMQRDHITTNIHRDLIANAQPLLPEFQRLGVNTSDVESLGKYAEYVTLGGDRDKLTSEAVVWLESFHKHYVGNLEIGAFDQGKMLTFELVTDIMSNLEAKSSFALYITPQITFTALLKILTLFTEIPQHGSVLTITVSDTQEVQFSLSSRLLVNDYCGSPCLLSAFSEKMRGKRMYGNKGIWTNACTYMGDDDLSWAKYYWMVGVMAVLWVFFKGSDWLVRKTAPRPKQQ